MLSHFPESCEGRSEVDVGGVVKVGYVVEDVSLQYEKVQSGSKKSRWEYFAPKDHTSSAWKLG